jgi:hypothetical protein
MGLGRVVLGMDMPEAQDRESDHAESVADIRAAGLPGGA